MAYEYHEEIVNENKVEDFFKNVNFVGYILPDGKIYRAKDHNIESMTSFFNMTIENLLSNYADKNKFLEASTNDQIADILLNYFKNVSYEEVVALNQFIKQNNLSLSDILVAYFRCHLVTRTKKEILTSANDFRPFHNYILMGFNIRKIDKMLYKDKSFYFIDDRKLENDYYLDEMHKLMAETREDERNLFFR